MDARPRRSATARNQEQPMMIVGLTHVNINCSDYERSKTFYEMLGFEEFSVVPATNTPELGVRPTSGQSR